tara:strand:- start:12692 stop:14599 length:1908 start_codon:yes stop_codon:yes gene_type:complete
LEKKDFTPKIIIITLPLREVPSSFPPLGSLSIITALKRAGFKNTKFYNLDLLRPTYEAILANLEREKPDILGISAVVSTGYGFTKKLSLDVKNILPNTTILLGGNMGASAEVVLKKTGVDFICTGEGDKTVVDFVSCWLSAKDKCSYENVDGLAYLDDNSELMITPYAESISAENVYDIDWSILEDLDQLKYFIQSKDTSHQFNNLFSMDPRSFELHRKNKTSMTIVGSKGCVAKCSFCHRWDTGIRYIPVQVLMKRIDYFIEKYNLGFIDFGDENFGSDKKWLDEFLKQIKTRDLIWGVHGMRARSASSELMEKMKDAGCCRVTYGFESGSQAMLDVMDKVTSVKQNYDALRWTVENKLQTSLQLLLGMPGENPKTVGETAKFASFFAGLSPSIDPNDASINFAQALPGTPLYEFARRKGFIGPTLEDEEKYLLEISDRDARDGETNINFTDYPKLLLENWHFEIQLKTRNAYIQKWGIKSYQNMVSKSFNNSAQMNSIAYSSNADSNNRDSGNFAYPLRAKEELAGESEIIPSIWWFIKKKIPGLIPMIYPTLFWRMRCISILFVLPWSAQKYGVKVAINMCIEYMRWKILSFTPSKKKTVFNSISLRKTILRNLIPKIPTDNPVMAIIRKGR